MIRLIDILKAQGVALGRYKIHLATAGTTSPLEAYWQGRFKEWQEEQNAKNFQCDTVIGLIQRGGDRWLFGGVYRILGVQEGVRTPFRYETELLAGQDDLVGRVIVKFKRVFRNSYIRGDKYGHQLEVAEILDSALSIEESLCAKINETPSLPEFTVAGGEGNPHEEEVEWRCTGPTRFGFAWCGAE